MNPILQLAENIRNATNHLCGVGPGPFGFGVSTKGNSDINLVLSFDPDPVLNNVIFSDEIDTYEVKVVGYIKGGYKRCSLDDISAYASSEQSNENTQIVAEAILALGKEVFHVTTDECHEAFNLMAKYAMNNEKGYLDIRSYLPPDDVSIRYSWHHSYHDGKEVGGGPWKGHVAPEDILFDPFITEAFSRCLSLQEISVTVRYFIYGAGDIVRDANEDELELVLRGAYNDLEQEVSQQNGIITRSDVNLPPVSPLTDRGMSLFFTAAADWAEQMGFDVNGIVDGQLQISNDGMPVVNLYEEGCGSHIYLKDKDPFFVLFPTGPYVSSILSVGQEGPLNDRIRNLLSTVKELRSEIQEVLHPADYPYAEQMDRAPEEQSQGSTMNL